MKVKSFLRFYVCVACERRVESFEPLGRHEQERRRVGTAARGERDLPAQTVYLRMLEFVERSGLGRRQQPRRGVESARLEFGLRCGQRTLGPADRVERQRRRPFQERRCGRHATACPRPAGRALQLRGDFLVGTGRCLRAITGAAIGIELWISHVRQRTSPFRPSWSEADW
jgi:hypothetical protein